jgi:hypothetical protein
MIAVSIGQVPYQRQMELPLAVILLSHERQVEKSVGWTLPIGIHPGVLRI